MQYYRIIAGRRAGGGEISGGKEPVYRLEPWVWVGCVVRTFRCKSCGGVSPSLTGCVLCVGFGGVL